jgi:hypothetical protein
MFTEHSEVAAQQLQVEPNGTPYGVIADFRTSLRSVLCEVAVLLRFAWTSACTYRRPIETTSPHVIR